MFLDCFIHSFTASSSTEEGNSETSTTPLDSPMSPPPQQQRRRFLKLVSEGDVQLCRITNDSGTVISKILGSKYLRRWETHHLYLNDAQISSKTVRTYVVVGVVVVFFSLFSFIQLRKSLRAYSTLRNEPFIRSATSSVYLSLTRPLNII